MDVLRKIDQRFNLSKLADYFSAAKTNFFGPTFAYYAILALIPTVVVVGVSFKAFGVSEDLIIPSLIQLLPESVENVVIPIVEQALGDRSLFWYTASGLIFFWTIGALLGILRQTFNRIYGYKERISDFFSRFFAFFWFILVIAILSVLIIITALGSNIIEFLLEAVGLSVSIDQSFIYGLFLGIYILLCLINNFLPAKKPMWRFTLIGTAIELIFLYALNMGFNAWVMYAIDRYSAFQALSAFIVLLIYLNLLGVVLVSGQVFIAWLQYNYKIKGKRGEDVKNKSHRKIKE